MDLLYILQTYQKNTGNIPVVKQIRQRKRKSARSLEMEVLSAKYVLKGGIEKHDMTAWSMRSFCP